ncbi:hypothetical protein AUJ44_04455 [Candidatus Nomurabacteria bacterium CG1_02_47_685]|nr:MAG: hypothetical protein AUJ44_04455 [Candidatus Nomurabacteria bacterium CG1_02_47_685]
MKKKVYLFLLVGTGALVLPFCVMAVTNFDITAFRSIKDISIPAIIVPTVVEVPFTGDEIVNASIFAVIDKDTKLPVPSFYRETRSTNETLLSLLSIPPNQELRLLTDHRYDTFANFLLPEGSEGSVTITALFGKSVTSSSLSIGLDKYVALPTSIEIRVLTATGDRIVLAKTKMTSQKVDFPKTSADRWTITFTYGQPLRLTELSLRQDDAEKTTTRGMRFLAAPGKTYQVYFNPDRPVKVSVGESGNLRNDAEVLMLEQTPSFANTAYVRADIDTDGIPDMLDNCVNVSNADQADINSNGRGDACDDFDRDGIINSIDNCLNDPNANQRDTDGDGEGDACDAEESRITEKYGFLPWVGMGIAATVVVILLVLTMKGMKHEQFNEENIADSNNGTGGTA